MCVVDIIIIAHLQNDIPSLDSEDLDTLPILCRQPEIQKCVQVFSRQTQRVNAFLEVYDLDDEEDDNNHPHRVRLSLSTLKNEQAFVSRKTNRYIQDT